MAYGRRSRRRTSTRTRRSSVRGYGAYKRRRTAPARRRTVARRATTRRAPTRRASSTRKSIAGQLLDLGTDVAQYLPYGGLVTKGLSVVRSISGMGDYRTSNNSLVSKWTSNGPPEIVNTTGEGGGFRIRHREYLGDISSGAGTPTQFNLFGAYPLNPGMQSTFPWLSTIANNFEQYKFHGIIFEYKTLSVDAIASSTMNVGAVIMATEYNVLHPPFISKQQMENYEFCSSAKPSQSIIHPIECAPSETPLTKLYIRQGPITKGDLRLYDLGLFQIATVGLPVQAGNIGELWVSYEVEFFKPTLPSVSTGTDSPMGLMSVMFYSDTSLMPVWTGPNGAKPGPFGYGNSDASTINLPRLRASYSGPGSTINPPWLYYNPSQSRLGFVDSDSTLQLADFGLQDGTVALGSSSVDAGINTIYFSNPTTAPMGFLVNYIYSNAAAAVANNYSWSTTNGCQTLSAFGQSSTYHVCAPSTSLSSTSFSETIAFNILPRTIGEYCSATFNLTGCATGATPWAHVIITQIY